MEHVQNALEQSVSDQKAAAEIIAAAELLAKEEGERPESVEGVFVQTEEIIN